MWKMPKFQVIDGRFDRQAVIVFNDEMILPLKFTEGQVYVVKPGPWPHVGRKGTFVPTGDNEVVLDESPNETDPDFLFSPDPRSLEAVVLH